jgi:hypothetical protein
MIDISWSELIIGFILGCAVSLICFKKVVKIAKATGRIKVIKKP